MKQPLRVAMLLVGLVALDVVALLALQMTGETWPHPLAATVVGLALGQAGLAALYFAFGRSNIAFRAAVHVAACGAMGYLASQATVEGMRFGPWWMVLLAASLPLLVAGFAARMLGVRFGRDSDSPEPRLQFSIGWLLSLTAAIALVVGVARYLPVPDEQFLPELLWFCLLANGSPALATLTAARIDRLRYSLPLLLILLPVSGALFGFIYIVDPWYFPLGGFIIFGTVQGFLVFGSLCVLKGNGYRFRFNASHASRASPKDDAPGDS